MTLARDFVVPGLTAEYEAFAGLLVGLTGEQWERPTRCGEWRTADVAAHVTGTLSDVANLRLERLGTPDVTQRQVDERRGRTPAELADELVESAKLAADLLASFDDTAWDGPTPGGLAGTLGHSVETLMYDTYVHADDIRAALGQASVRSNGLTASVSHLAQSLSDQGWGPAELHLDGLDPIAISGGGGRTVVGDPLAFVLVASGRADPATLGLDATVNVYRAV